MCNDAQSSLADIIYGSQTELQKQVVMSDRAFLFLYYAYLIILNDRLCRIYSFFSAALFTVLTARC